MAKLTILIKKAVQRIPDVDILSLLSLLFALDRFQYTANMNLDAVFDLLFGLSATALAAIGLYLTWKRRKRK